MANSLERIRGKYKGEIQGGNVDEVESRGKLNLLITSSQFGISSR